MDEPQDCFEQCRALLATQRKSLLEECLTAWATIARADLMIENIDQSLLTFPPTDKSKRRCGSSSKPKPQCCTKEEILAGIRQVLADGPRDAIRLKNALAMRFRDEGKNLSMFSKLFDSCLTDRTLLREDQGVYSLRSVAPNAGKKAPITPDA